MLSSPICCDRCLRAPHEFVNLSRQGGLSYQETLCVGPFAVSIPYIVGHDWLPSMRGDIFTTSTADKKQFRIKRKEIPVQVRLSNFLRTLADGW